MGNEQSDALISDLHAIEGSKNDNYLLSSDWQ